MRARRKSTAAPVDCGLHSRNGNGINSALSTISGVQKVTKVLEGLDVSGGGNAKHEDSIFLIVFVENRKTKMSTK